MHMVHEQEKICRCPQSTQIPVNEVLDTRPVQFRTSFQIL